MSTNVEIAELRAEVREWEDWSNELAMLLPEDAETWPGANPEGAQESIVTACVIHLVKVWEAARALADEWEAEAEGIASDLPKESQAIRLDARALRDALEGGAA